MTSNKIALITGASSGIGKSLAYEFAKRHYDLVLVARRGSLLLELAADLKNKYHVDSTILAVDLAKDDASKRITEAIKDRINHIEVLVNNAGIGDHVLFSESNSTRIDDMLHININTLVDLTHFFLPLMVQRQQGYILNVASTAAMQPIPMMAVYAASKAFVLSFTQAIAAEVADKNVHITAFCPGPVLTEFSERANMGEANLSNAPMLEVMDPDTVAKMGIEALFMNKRVCIAGWRNRLIILFSKFVPQGFAIAMARKFMQKRSS